MMKTLPALLVALLGVMVLSWAAREAHHIRIPFSESDSSAWFSVDSDGLYHLRRLRSETGDDGFPLALDESLNWPLGAAVPWPPYYTSFLKVLGLVPAEGESSALAAWVPFVLGVLTSLLLALLAWRMSHGNALAAWLAGGLHALTYASIHYSVPGNADHHAWVAFLVVILFATLGRALVKCCWVAACVSGLMAGVLLGSWVASIVVVLVVQLGFGILLWIDRFSPRPEVGRAGLLFHLVAASAVLPAVLHSPWQERSPWTVVNLSWFHFAFLIAGGLVFVPMVWPKASLRMRGIGPFQVVIVLLGAILVFWVTDTGPVAGIQEAFSWATRTDAFMAGIAESEPLWGLDQTGTGGFFRWLGLSALLLPWVLWQTWLQVRSGFRDRLFWMLALAVFLILALFQRRFGDLAALPLAVIVGLGVADRLQKFQRQGGFTRKPIVRVFAAVLIVFALQAPELLRAFEMAGQSRFDSALVGQRLLMKELRPMVASEREAGRSHGVLSTWDQGHALEWAAGAPTVATNFGSYIGRESFIAPADFFLAKNANRAKEVLSRRKVGFVWMDSRFRQGLPTMISALGDDLSQWMRSIEMPNGMMRTEFQEQYFQTPAHALEWDGDADGPDGPIAPLDYVRLVALSEMGDADPRLGFTQTIPAARVWQYVAGADLQWMGEAGTKIVVDIPMEMRGANREVYFRWRWHKEMVIGENTLARMRVPYATIGRASFVSGQATWQLGDSPAQPLLLSNEDVLLCSQIQLRQ
jgi:asparagine N-glycosylation enzyme membrane subunit Stt3